MLTTHNEERLTTDRSEDRWYTVNDGQKRSRNKQNNWEMNKTIKKDWKTNTIIKKQNDWETNKMMEKENDWETSLRQADNGWWLVTVSMGKHDF